jgi:hypothetical protein
MATTTPFIVAEIKNGSAFAKSAYICRDEADFISRIAALAIRSDAEIDSVESAIAYLNERYAQRTRIVTRADFDAMTSDSWDTAVLDMAAELGWYEAPQDDEEE